MFSRETLANLLYRPSTYAEIESLWMRALGIVYIAAFGSLWPQITGLIGSNGIVPASQFLAAVRNDLGTASLLAVPTWFWLGISNGGLIGACVIGCLGGISLALGRFRRVACVLCFSLYLSIVVIGAPFTNFQWDALLLEAGFLALFAGSPLLVWAYRVLLFRLMFESGVVKLLSHDPNWRNGHALRFHFLTQPLPNPVAYYAYRLPNVVLDGMTWITLAIELVAPFLLFAPRRARYFGLAAIAGLQLLILLTGNYAFFNWLTLALCLWGLDSHVRVLRWWPLPVPSIVRKFHEPFRLAASLALLYLMLVGAAQLLLMLEQQQSAWVTRLTKPIATLEVVNTYGLFAVMTTTRPEIIIEGSNDAKTWSAYRFRYKPGNLNRPLPWVAPYHPRLDWQMWFAALGSPGENQWIAGLFYRILKGDRDVLSLMESPPFPKPPLYLRALLYTYEFTTPQERLRTSAVWQRQQVALWYGPVAVGKASAEH